MWPSALMLLPFGIVFGMGLVFVLLMNRQARLNAARRLTGGPEWLPTGWRRGPSYRPTPFERPCRWLAVRSGNAAAVQAALALNNATPCAWTEMALRLGEGKLFISPPVADWTLVMGPGLPDPVDDVDECFHFVRYLSGKLGQVQFFSFNRVVGHHAWARAVDGRVVRAYAWCGQTVWNQGDLTSAELDLGLKCLAYGEKSGPTGFGITPLEHANSERIVALAARWSVDPAAIEVLAAAGATGIAGDRSRLRVY